MSKTPAIARALRGKKKPRGRPFKKGELPPVGHPPWPKGTSGNPEGGRLTQTQRLARFRERADGLFEDFLDTFLIRAIGFNENTPKKGKLSRENIISAITTGRLKLSPEYAKIHIDRLLGKQALKLEHSGEGGKPIEIGVIVLPPEKK